MSTALSILEYTQQQLVANCLQRHITAYKLAQMLPEISERTIKKFYKADTPVSFYTLELICRTLGLDLADIFPHRDEPVYPPEILQFLHDLMLLPEDRLQFLMDYVHHEAEELLAQQAREEAEAQAAAEAEAQAEAEAEAQAAAAKKAEEEKAVTEILC